MTRQKFTIGVATPPGMSAAYAYFAPAIALGYDREEGLEFDIFYGGEPAGTARKLCAGACDVACLNTIVGFIGRAEGLPMIAVGSKARRAHRYFAVPRESAIRSLAELKGKKIACDFPHLQSLAEAALAEEGVSRGSFEWVAWHGSGMEARQMIEPLQTGAVDAVFLMDWNDGDFVALELPLRHLRSKLLERIRVSSCYWTTEAKLAQDKDLLSRGLRAVQKSLTFSFQKPQSALRMMWQTFPETKPGSASSEEMARRQLEILKACLEPMRIDANDLDPRWCAIPSQEMLEWQSFLRRSGTKGAEVDASHCYTTALVDPINDFDEALARSAAQRAQPS